METSESNSNWKIIWQVTGVLCGVVSIIGSAFILWLLFEIMDKYLEDESLQKNVKLRQDFDALVKVSQSWIVIFIISYGEFK